MIDSVDASPRSSAADPSVAIASAPSSFMPSAKGFYSDESPEKDKLLAVSADLPLISDSAIEDAVKHSI